MRKLIPLLLTACLLFSAGCSLLLPEPSESDVLAEVAGQDVHIRFDEDSTLSGTVEGDGVSYRFAYAENYDLEILYPDGKSYLWDGGSGQWPHGETAAQSGWLPGEDLALSLDLASGADLARNPPEDTAQQRGVSPFIAVILAALGLWLLLSPKRAWNIFVESFRPEAEPRPRTLLIYRLVGAALALTGLLLLFL